MLRSKRKSEKEIVHIYNMNGSKVEMPYNFTKDHIAMIDKYKNKSHPSLPMLNVKMLVDMFGEFWVRKVKSPPDADPDLAMILTTEESDEIFYGSNVSWGELIEICKNMRQGKRKRKDLSRATKLDICAALFKMSEEKNKEEAVQEKKGLAPIS